MVLIKECDNNIKRRLIFKGTTLQNLMKIVDEAIGACLLQLHKKLSNVQSIFKEVNSFPFLCIQWFFSKFTHKTSNRT